MEAATLSNVIIEQQLTVGLLDKLFRIEITITQQISSVSVHHALSLSHSRSLYFVANLCDSMLCVVVMHTKIG